MTNPSHHTFIRPALGLFGLVLTMHLLVACAPTAPVVRDAATLRSGSLSPFGPVIEERLANTASERADTSVERINALLRAGQLEVSQVLSALAPYSINEVRWQAQNHRNRPQLTAWLELAVVVRTHSINPTTSTEALTRWGQRHRHQMDTAPAKAQAELWLDQWRAQNHGPRTVGVILPQNSAFARPGEAIQDGMMDAWLAIAPSQRPKLVFYYVDDGQTAELFDVIDQAVKDNIDWLVGPLARTDVEDILRARGAQWPLPTLLLNTPTNPQYLRRLGENRLAFALSPEVDAKQAAYQADRLGLDRALVLAQDTPWGQRMADAFITAYRSTGRRVVDQAWYDPLRVDHSALLQSVLGLNASQARIDEISRLIGEEVASEPQRRTDIEFIFLASRAEDARQIRPQLQFFRAEDLPVLSTSHAIDGAVDARRDVDLEGLYLPMPPWFITGSSADRTRQLAQNRYPEIMNEASLSHLYAMGHDITQIIRWLEPLRDDSLLTLHGMTGHLSVDTSGLIQRDLMPVMIRNGRTLIQDENQAMRVR